VDIHTCTFCDVICREDLHKSLVSVSSARSFCACASVGAYLSDVLRL
jgi:hypothetical protein